MSRVQNSLTWFGAGLLLAAAGCIADSHGGGEKGDRPASNTQLRGSKTSLVRANSCDDLLAKIQNDAIAKLDLAVERAKQQFREQGRGDGAEETDDVGGVATPPVSGFPPGGFADAGTASPVTSGGTGGTTAGTSIGGLGGGGLLAGTGGTGAGQSTGTPGGAGNAGSPTAPRDPIFEGGPTPAPGAQGEAPDPIGSSDTNNQVAEVDEADFVKIVENGRGMFLLNGSSLRRLKTYPPEQLSIEAPEIKIEGSATELFVTGGGRAVVFSNVSGYSDFGGALGGGTGGGKPIDVACEFGRCGGGYFGGITKITLVDVSGDTFRALRELYYQGSYVSSRRYDDIVRVVLQGERSYDNLYQPEIDGYDPWGRPYEQEVIDDQLAQWRDRIAASVRNTKLSDWIPAAKEHKDGALVELTPDCDAYYVPQPGFADSGLVQVLAIDASKDDAAIGGVAVVGRASTIYSNLDRLVLAQPDYRWDDTGAGDFGFIDQQRTTLHTFALSGDETTYLASGWVPGHLPVQNQQFGLDVSAGHTLRIATSGRVRAHPDAKPNTSQFWETGTENLVMTLHEVGSELKIAGKSDPLGHEGETVQSARFVGDRAYVVTFRQTDPLIVLDVSSDDEPVVLGEIEIPGFSQYMHPLDDDHLITFGRSGTGGSQLQLFDVSDPLQIPAPKTLDFGSGSSSEVGFSHKAFTFYAPLGLIALPVTASNFSTGVYNYASALRVIHVDPKDGFELLGSIDHSGFADASYGCFSCGAFGCQRYCSAGTPEIRRGHVVETSETAYIYAIGYGGVTVNDVEDLTKPIASLKLPGARDDLAPWYGPGGDFAGGGFVGGGITGGGGFFGGTVNPTTPASPPISTPPGSRPGDGMAVATPVDAGAGPTPVVDAGVDGAADAGVAIVDAG